MDNSPSLREALPIYETAKARRQDHLHGLRKQKEAYTRTAFLDPLLKDLGWQFVPEAELPKGTTRKRPDYCLFTSIEARQQAAAQNETVGVFRFADTALEAKKWQHPLDELREESLTRQAELELNLRRRIFDALEDLATAFRHHNGNKLTQADHPALYDNSLILLYRLLFVLYAESRALLPVRPHGYGSNKIYRDKTKYADDAFTDLCEQLLKLFHLINGENEEQNRKTGVARYNGGLFNPQLHLLKLNLVDLAMGSGHFLVRATEWLAERIVYHPTTRLMTELIVPLGQNRRSREDILKEDKIPGPGGYGVVLLHPKKRAEFSGGVRLITGNRMEAYAAITLGPGPAKS